MREYPCPTCGEECLTEDEYNQYLECEMCADGASAFGTAPEEERICCSTNLARESGNFPIDDGSLTRMWDAFALFGAGFVLGAICALGLYHLIMG